MKSRKNIVPRLQEHVAFDAPVETDDGYGGTQTAWTDPGDAHEARAEFIYARGSEAVDAARLTGRSIYKVRIRHCSAAAAITTDWRMRDLRRGDSYNVIEVDAITDRRWIYIAVEGGVAV